MGLIYYGLFFQTIKTITTTMAMGDDSNDDGNGRMGDKIDDSCDSATGDDNDTDGDGAMGSSES